MPPYVHACAVHGGARFLLTGRCPGEGLDVRTDVADHTPSVEKYCGGCDKLSNAVRRGVILAGALVIAAPAAGCETPVAAYRIVDGGIAEPLCGLKGDPARGRAIVAGRAGNCLACHRAPIPEEDFHGDIGPPLDGVGGRSTAAELRLRLVDASRLNTATVMPSFHRVAGLSGVRRDRIGQPLLTAQAIEDVVAYLLTLTEEPPRE